MRGGGGGGGEASSLPYIVLIWSQIKRIEVQIGVCLNEKTTTADTERRVTHRELTRRKKRNGFLLRIRVGGEGECLYTLVHKLLSSFFLKTGYNLYISFL